ncbi:carboxypeptidase regulatory-like domain-containing protein [Luteimonas mephitis]|uniref:carboxypeptidase regulatory-like domain-containing protein n=1 Tax=Luteimonas mephitis TaxID=83615 RepID=UPI003A91A7D5
MTAEVATALALAFTVLAASVRAVWRARHASVDVRPRAWRVIVLLLAQAASAALLYCVLFPPAMHTQAGTLVVATARADQASTAGLSPGERMVALPEAPALRGAERMPDLAAALRRYPATTRIRVLGAGLVARDQPAAQGRALDFVPAPLPRGLVALWPPQQVQAGRRFEVGGRAEGLPGGSAELLDPGNAVVARASIAADGRFRLAGTTRGAGPATWRLQLRDSDKRRVEDTTLPLVVEPGATLRVLVLAGAPNPELKYLRRWATDAGLSLDTRISLGAGMQIGDAPVAFDAASLGKFDLVVLDQRAWQSLGAARRAALDLAIRDGLGLLLRLSTVPDGADRSALLQLGFTATPAGSAREVRLPAALTGVGDETGNDGKALPTLTRAPLRIGAIDASPLVPDASGTPLASWRARGAGRIGIATFDDSFRLVLAGHGDRHGELWGTLFSTLARARGTPAPTVEGDAYAGQRVVLCGQRGRAGVDTPDGRSVAVLIDPASGPGGCAAFWPRQPGWYVLRTSPPAQPGDEHRLSFHVRAAGDVPGLQAAALREQTQSLAAASAPATAGVAATPGPRWPWFLAWLLSSAALWWFERSRAGIGHAVTAASRR